MCKVIPCKTIREKSGIAYSSRNNLLSNNQKKIASNVFMLIKKNKKNLINNKISLIKIKKIIYSMSVKKIDYIEILNKNKIIKPFKKKIKYKIFFAYYLGSTR